MTINIEVTLDRSRAEQAKPLYEALEAEFGGDVQSGTSVWVVVTHFPFYDGVHADVNDGGVGSREMMEAENAVESILERVFPDAVSYPTADAG